SDDEVVVGRDLGWLDVPVTEEAVARHAAAVEDHHPWYSGPSPWGGPIAPALLFNRQPVWHRGWFLQNRHGTLLTRQDWDFCRPGDGVPRHRRGRADVALLPWRNADSELWRGLLLRRAAVGPARRHPLGLGGCHCGRHRDGARARGACHPGERRYLVREGRRH